MPAEEITFVRALTEHFDPSLYRWIDTEGNETSSGLLRETTSSAFTALRPEFVRDRQDIANQRLMLARCEAPPAKWHRQGSKRAGSRPFAPAPARRALGPS
jgi:hypothetical protein